MDSCGSPTPARPDDSVRRSIHRALATCRASARTLAGVVCFAFFAGCSMNIKYGTPPRTDQLKNFTAGVSAKSDVLRILGEPRGYGMARLSIGTQPRSIWSYEYVESEGKKMNLKMLLVFFEQDRYDGHLWFAGSSLIDVKE